MRTYKQKCTNTYVYIYVYILMYILTHIPTCIYVNTYIHVASPLPHQTYKYVHMYICMLYIYTYVCICICMYEDYIPRCKVYESRTVFTSHTHIEAHACSTVVSLFFPPTIRHKKCKCILCACVQLCLGLSRQTFDHELREMCWAFVFEVVRM